MSGGYTEQDLGGRAQSRRPAPWGPLPLAFAEGVDGGVGECTGEAWGRCALLATLRARLGEQPSGWPCVAFSGLTPRARARCGLASWRRERLHCSNCSC